PGGSSRWRSIRTSGASRRASTARKALCSSCSRGTSVPSTNSVASGAGRAVAVTPRSMDAARAGTPYTTACSPRRITLPEELPSFAGQAASLDRDARFVAQGDDALLHDGLGTTLLQDLDGPLDRSLGRPRSAEHGLEQLSPWAATALQGELDEEGAFPRSQ